MIVSDGDPAVGVGAGESFEEVLRPSINDAGDVLFAGYVGEFNTPRGVWIARSGVVAPVFFDGLDAPGLPGVRYATDTSTDRGIPMFNNRGEVAFLIAVAGPDPNSNDNLAIFAGPATDVSLLARRGSSPSSEPGGPAFSLFAPPNLNNGGNVAFSATLDGGDAGIFVSGPSGLHRRVALGAQAPGLDPGVTFSNFNEVLINDSGQIAFKGGVSGLSAREDSGIWAGAPNDLQLAAQGGAPAPGTETTFDGFNNGGFRDPVFNAKGQVAFWGSLDSASETNHGIWAGAPENLQLIARRGHTLPGRDGEVPINNLNPPAISDTGEVAFLGYRSDVPFAESQGMWFGTSGDLQFIAGAGEDAPGTTTGVEFSVFDQPIVNDIGQIAFRAELTGDGVTSLNRFGIWATDLDGSVELLLRTGDEIPLGADRFGTVLAIDELVGSENQRDLGRSSFNRYGELVVQVTLAEDAATYTSIVVLQIPAPASLLLAAGLIPLTMRRRR